MLRDTVNVWNKSITKPYYPRLTTNFLFLNRHRISREHCIFVYFNAYGNVGDILFYANLKAHIGDAGIGGQLFR